MCHSGCKSSKRTHQHIPFYIHFCIKKHMQEGVWLLYLSFQNHNTQTGTGKFICNVSLLDVKELLLKPDQLWNHISPSTTRSAFLAKMSCSNYPAILKRGFWTEHQPLWNLRIIISISRKFSIFYHLAS